MSEWISIKDKMPPDDKNVLLYFTHHGYEYAIGYYCPIYKQWVLIADEACGDKVSLFRGECPTHWMPLPEPPEEDKCLK